MSERKLQLKINSGISYSYSTLIILILLLVFYLLYHFFITTIESEFHKKLTAIAEVGALAIDVEKHETIQTEADGKKQNFIDLTTTLNEIRKSSKSIKFIYTVRMDHEGKLVFVVDPDEGPKQINRDFEGTTETTIKAFQKPYRSWVEKEFSESNYGNLLSAYAPIYSKKGEFVGILGVDMEFNFLLEFKQNILLIMFLIMLCMIILAIILSLFLSKRIVKPLEQLTSELDHIRKLHFNESLQINTFLIEIDQIYQATQNLKNSLRSFSKYVPAKLVLQLSESNQEAKLAGKKERLTIFFSDIEGFTNLSERSTPDELVKIMENYFSVMSEVIEEHQGTLDKYIGDAIMAFWGDPLPVKNHEYLACAAAIQCMHEVRRVGLNTRIGINTGEVFVGNVGYKNRLNYTVMGNNVNIASRLEALNKEYSTNILISEETYLAVKGQFLIRPIEQVRLKGKSIHTSVYELIDHIEQVKPQKIEWQNAYCAGYDAFLKEDWELALVNFQRAIVIIPNDVITISYIQRSYEYLKINRIAAGE